jgi:hypothetical protein
MKLFLCAIAALTLSISTMNAQEKADVITANKTEVTKKANKTQLVEVNKTATEDSKSEKAVLREDTKGAKGNYSSTKDQEVKKEGKKTDAQLKKEKKAKQKAKSIDN